MDNASYLRLTSSLHCDSVTNIIAQRGESNVALVYLLDRHISYDMSE